MPDPIILTHPRDVAPATRVDPGPALDKHGHGGGERQDIDDDNG